MCVRLVSAACQNQFAALVHVSVKTLRNWEQGIRRPGGAAAALLTAIRNDPKNVIAVLNADRAQSGRI
jgi:DNA-binding transcriptional regulator YiaG